jgi:hypothetical protein
LRDTINEIRFLQEEAKYSSGDKAILEAFESVEDFKRESEYSHKRRYNQIESIRNFPNTLRQLYDRLELEEAELQQQQPEIIEQAGE